MPGIVGIRRISACSTSTGGSEGCGRGKVKRAQATLPPGQTNTLICIGRLGAWSRCAVLRAFAGLGKELRRHTFPVDNDPLHSHLIDRLFIAVEQVRQPNRQVLIPSMRGCE